MWLPDGGGSEAVSYLQQVVGVPHVLCLLWHQGDLPDEGKQNSESAFHSPPIAWVRVTIGTLPNIETRRHWLGNDRVFFTSQVKFWSGFKKVNPDQQCITQSSAAGIWVWTLKRIYVGSYETTKSSGIKTNPHKTVNRGDNLKPYVNIREGTHALSAACCFSRLTLATATHTLTHSPGIILLDVFVKQLHDRTAALYQFLLSLHGAGVWVDSSSSHFLCRWDCRVASRAMSSTEWITPCVLPGAWTLRHMPKYVVDPFPSRSLPWVSLWRWRRKKEHRRMQKARFDGREAPLTLRRCSSFPHSHA